MTMTTTIIAVRVFVKATT